MMEDECKCNFSQIKIAETEEHEILVDEDSLPQVEKPLARYVFER